MVTKIVFEIVAGLVIVTFGSTWWALFKRDRLLRKTLDSKDYLEHFLTRNRLDRARDHPMLAGPFDLLGYEKHLILVEVSDKKAQVRLKIMLLILPLVAIVASYWLGIWFVVGNIVLFIFAVFFPLGESGAKNAIDQMLVISAILHNWSKQNDEEGMAWVRGRRKYQTVYSVVREIT